MRDNIPDETIKQATDLFYSCEPVVDKQDGTLYLPISDIAKIQTSKSSVLSNLNLKELETTFRLLDVNGDGKLTLEEFVDGFSQFLMAAQSTETARIIQKRRAEEEVIKNQELKGEVTRARENSVASLAIIQQLFSSSLYNTIKTTMPNMVPEFQSMIQQASNEIDEVQKSMQQLEGKLESHTGLYHKALDQAYTELESNIRQAEEASKQRAEQREKQITTEWDQILAEKVEQVNELKQKIEEVNQKAEELKHIQAEETQEISLLKKKNDELMESLEEVEISVEESKQTIEELQTKAKLEQAKREKTDASTCQRVQIECEELMRKLDQLREQNRRLRDERDEALHEHRSRNLASCGSLMDEVNEVFGRENVPMGEDVAAVEKPVTYTATVQGMESGELRIPEDAVMVATEVFSDEDYEFEDSWSQSVESSRMKSSIYESEPMETSFNSMQLEKTQPVQLVCLDFGDHLKNTQLATGMNGHLVDEPKHTERGLRMFKVAVIGQSGAGKTALIRRICGDKDCMAPKEVEEKIMLRMYSLDLDGEHIVLQLCDIQGDDKYFPVNQYLCEKADGAIFVYDGSSMSDFNELDRRILKLCKETQRRKPWADSVNALWANKWDLIDLSLTHLAVPKTSAEGLAKTLEADYFEVSAETGYNVDTAFEHLVRKLCQTQDEKLKVAREDMFHSEERKSGCLSCCYCM